MAIYKIFAKFTTESDIKGEDAERIIKDTLKTLATGVQISSVDIEKSDNEEEEIGGA
jgi:hypothetical protein